MHPSPVTPGPASAEWRALGVGVQVLVSEPVALERARTVLQEELAALDLACSRFRQDSEIQDLARAGGRPLRASPLLVEAVRAALWAAESTDGAVDPTLGAALVRLGYDRDFASLGADPAAWSRSATVGVRLNQRASWRDVSVEDDTVQVPDGVLLDLGATAKALGADRAAERLAAELGCGVLVNLGGDLRICGPAPAGGWVIRVQDQAGPVDADPGGSHQTVALTDGGLATSSTAARRWEHGGATLHHLIDPISLVPVVSPWRTVSVTAPSCLAANAASTAAFVKGGGGLAYLVRLGLPARLVAVDDHVQVLHGWPA